MNPILEKLGSFGIVPVVVLNDPQKAVALGRALIDGGLPCAEITFRTPAACEALNLMHKAYPDMLLGAGTVLTPEQADRAVLAGASFIVSPGLNPKVVKHCQKKNIPVIPGVVTPTEMEAAMELHLELVKFFPAELSGGLAMIKAVAAPYTTLKFMPTGGISPDNITEYLAYDRVFACGGSWMVKSDLIDRNDFDTITNLTRQAVQLVHSIR